MLRREWTAPAVRQLEHAQDRYHAINPAAATALAQRVLDAARTLAEQPVLGRAGRVAGTREWRVGQTPYVLVYRVRGDALEVLHVWCNPQDWMPRAEPTIERFEPWIAALISASLHLLMVLALMSASTLPITPPQGAASGGRMKVDFVGETSGPEQSAPPSPPPPPATSPVRSTLVKEAKNPLPPDAAGRVAARRPVPPVQ
ncbi:MAG TPA: plasmid stabilization protein ParE, partial [Xanthomonadaceae bacterium]|nr:plasmid stabilization protein ParE [Xanthomonadaceae bacterium]